MTLPSLPLRAVRFAGATLLLLVIGVAVAPSAYAASAGELETCFLTQINDARTNEGAQPLSVLPSLSEYGRTHSTDMANAGELFHSGAAQIEPHLPAGWRAWGENVGYATGSQSCDWLFEGFWESPGHRDNLLNPIFDAVGIGVIVDASDTIWTTHVFVQTESTPQPTTTTTAPPTPPPPTTTTTTTTSTTTTTTSAATSTTTTTTTSPETAPTPTSTSAPGTAPSAPVALTASSSTTLDPAPLVAGVATPCTTGCSETTAYAVFLGLVAAGGLAISWWAFRS